MFFGPYFIILIFLSSVKWARTSESEDFIKPFATINRGVFFQKIPNVMVYQGSMPIHFTSNLVLPKSHTPYVNYCPPNTTPCDVHDSTMAFHDAIWSDILEGFPYIKSTDGAVGGKTKRGLMNFMGEGFKYLYGTATTTDVNALHVENQYLEQRQKELQDALNTKQKEFAKFTTEINSYSKQMANVVENRLANNRLEIEKLGNKSFVVFDTLSLITHNQYLLHLETKANFISSDCRNKLIPRSVLTNKVLESSITELGKKLNEFGYKLASTIDELFKIPITECFYTKDKLQIEVHIPYTLEEEKYEIFEVIRIPFQFGSQQCILLDETQFIAVKGNTVIPITKHMAKFCSPYERSMCLIPSNIRDPDAFGNCAQTLMSGKDAEINRECIFKCYESNSTRVTEISPGELTITNTHLIEIFSINSEEKARKYKIEDQVGAILLRIPCDSDALIHMMDSTLKPYRVHGQFPCSSKEVKETVLQFLPPQMSKIEGMLFDDHPIQFNNVSDLLDPDWHLKIPTLNISAPTPFKFSAFHALDQINLEFGDSKLWMQIWLLILTVSLGFLYLYQFFGPIGTKWTSLSPFSFLISLPCVLADDGITFSSTIWSLLKTLEIANIILGISGTLIALIFIIVLWKIYRFSKCTYHLTRSLVNEIDLPEIRTRH